ncbi:MAG: hypothetical protein GY820_20250, partial [Gammaproteobacteria bacterium]|nr:hypothetical protein [Gammaproteobacteria bacterium]
VPHAAAGEQYSRRRKVGESQKQLLPPNRPHHWHKRRGARAQKAATATDFGARVHHLPRPPRPLDACRCSPAPWPQRNLAFRLKGMPIGPASGFETTTILQMDMTTASKIPPTMAGRG